MCSAKTSPPKSMPPKLTPKSPQKSSETSMQTLLDIMTRLRDPETGCAWDVAQNFESIAPYTIEEAYEVSEAIASGNREHIKDELGDLLLQIVFHARIAEEEESFRFENVVQAICTKMIRRHPHVFGEHKTKNMKEIQNNWEKIKARERGEEESILDGITKNLPAMTRAVKLQKRVASVGFDWHDLNAVIDKLREETEELTQAVHAHESAPDHDQRHDQGHKPVPDPAHDHVREEIGDILFVATNLARKAGLDPEMVLQQANRKFEKRFRFIEEALKKNGEDIHKAGLARLDEFWTQAKQAPNNSSHKPPINSK